MAIARRCDDDAPYSQAGHRALGRRNFRLLHQVSSHCALAFCRGRRSSRRELGFSPLAAWDVFHVPISQSASTCRVTDMYPHTAPLVTCLTKIYHPNIDLEGKVCLNILRDGWKPVLGESSGQARSGLARAAASDAVPQRRLRRCCCCASSAFLNVLACCAAT